MKNYDNGAVTRRLILDACKELFYTKGFRETTSGDICQKAHVIRSSIYYHFKDKDAIRYEVLWEYVIAMRHLAGRYCQDKSLSLILSMYVLWAKTAEDENLRRFFLDYSQDYLVYDPANGMGEFWNVAYKHMYGGFRAQENISELAFASVYGFIQGLIRMAGQKPDAYTPKELFRQCQICSMTIWGFPQEFISQGWDTLEAEIARIPAEAIHSLDVTKSA